MLVNGFYNLMKSSTPPNVCVEKDYGGICLTFTDDSGDELQVVLSTEDFSSIIDWGTKSLAVTAKAT